MPLGAGLLLDRIEPIEAQTAGIPPPKTGLGLPILVRQRATPPWNHPTAQRHDDLSAGSEPSP
jgi:hypothetical protein